MSERIDRYLEGTLDRDALEPGERSEADAAARAVKSARSFIEKRDAPDVTAAVMQRLEELAPAASAAREGFVVALWRAMWTPRLVSVRPAYGLLVAGALVAMVAMGPFMARSRPDRSATSSADTAPPLLVQFRLEANAANVQLAGSFTNWEPAYELHQIAQGVWTITVSLPQGVHDYAFIVDGNRWVADPYAPRISDGFGGTNSRLTLLSPDVPRL